MQRNIVKKISIKNAVKDRDFKSLKDDTEILRLAGIARTFKMGEHPQYGPFYKFTGEFLSTDLRTGQECVSSVAYLPSPVDTMLVDALQNGDGESVEFAFVISVRPRADIPIGYEYIVRSLIESAPSDPLANLLSRIGYTGPADLQPAPSEKPAGKGKAKARSDDDAA